MTQLARSCLLLSLSVACLSAVASGARAAEDFYAGKRITLLVGSGGGSYEIQARILVKFIGKYIPGAPTFIVQGMPGAASIKMANHMFSVAPRDGTVIATGFNTIPTAPLTSPNEATYDARKLSWIGSASREVYAGYFWHTAPIKTMEEAKTTPARMGGSAVGSFSVDSAILANELFGTKFKIIIGYKGSGETQLAVERGEVDGVMGTNWNNLRRRSVDWLAKGQINMMVQYGLKKNPQIPGHVPLFIDFAKNDADLQVAKFWVSNLEHGKPYFAPPGIPEDRLAILRRAFDATMKDPEFLKEIEAASENIDGPMTGEALAQLVHAEAATAPAVVTRISDTIQKFLKEGNR